MSFTQGYLARHQHNPCDLQNLCAVLCSHPCATLRDTTNTTAVEFMSAFSQLSELGFKQDKISEALLLHNSDKELAVAYMLEHSLD